MANGLQWVFRFYLTWVLRNDLWTVGCGLHFGDQLNTADTKSQSKLHYNSFNRLVHIAEKKKKCSFMDH